MILTTLSVVVLPARRQEIVEVFSSLMGPVRAEPGCRLCELYQQVDDGNVLRYVEEWETPEQLERHMRSARYERLLAIMEASAVRPVLRYDYVTGTRGLDYLEAVRLGTPATTPQERGERTGP
jgi:quinol monooxygenase YgiN